MRSPEDREPRDIVEPKQEKAALRYELAVRLASPHTKRTLTIRFYEDGRTDDWVCFVDGPDLMKRHL